MAGSDIVQAVGSHCRIAVVSTPRSGNTWLRRLLASLFRLEEFAAHTPDQVDWVHLPANCALQIHWPPVDAFVLQLARHHFQVVTLARHPLDVLISMLHFAQHEPETHRWLDGAGGDERLIVGARPLSPEFVGYAISRRAQLLLSVSAQWWRSPAVLRVRYEDLVSAPHKHLAQLAYQLGYEPLTPVDAAVAAHSLENARLTSENQHFRQGKPGIWRRFLTAPVALAIAEAHRDLFQLLDYVCDPDLTLDADRAHSNWQAHQP